MSASGSKAYYGRKGKKKKSRRVGSRSKNEAKGIFFRLLRTKQRVFPFAKNEAKGIFFPLLRTKQQGESFFLCCWLGFFPQQQQRERTDSLTAAKKQE
jgi:hypothetical protein